MAANGKSPVRVVSMWNETRHGQDPPICVRFLVAGDPEGE